MKQLQTGLWCCCPSLLQSKREEKLTPLCFSGHLGAVICEVLAERRVPGRAEHCCITTLVSSSCFFRKLFQQVVSLEELLAPCLAVCLNLHWGKANRVKEGLFPAQDSACPGWFRGSSSHHEAEHLCAVTVWAVVLLGGSASLGFICVCSFSLFPGYFISRTHFAVFWHFHWPASLLQRTKSVFNVFPHHSVHHCGHSFPITHWSRLGWKLCFPSTSVVPSNKP